MLKHIKIADEAATQHRLTYIDNYKNRNGYSPYYKNGTVDSLGNSRSASAPAYPNLQDLNEFVYLPDGTLVNVLEEDSDYTLISPVGTDLEYSVPRQYVRTDDCLTSLEKAIVVDRTNQNIATFEKGREYTSGGDKDNSDLLWKAEGNGIKAGWNDVWSITSYSMATTGKVGQYHQPTPLGYYYAIERRERFYYLQDGTNTIEGYAPYAVRFTAGAYIHGISTAYKYSSTGQRLDPGIKEFSSTIGTIPLSHKCVRNYTSHAKFVYNWYEHGKTIVIVIE
nr:L,D-transpeptidase [Clostridium aminobutyricum]